MGQPQDQLDFLGYMELAHIRHGQVADRGPAEVALPGTNYIIKAASAQKLESRGFSVAYLGRARGVTVYHGVELKGVPHMDE